MKVNLLIGTIVITGLVSLPVVAMQSKKSAWIHNPYGNVLGTAHRSVRIMPHADTELTSEYIRHPRKFVDYGSATYPCVSKNGAGYGSNFRIKPGERIEVRCDNGGLALYTNRGHYVFCHFASPLGGYRNKLRCKR